MSVSFVRDDVMMIATHKHTATSRGFLNVRDTLAGKVLAVFLSIVMVTTFSGFPTQAVAADTSADSSAQDQTATTDTASSATAASASSSASTTSTAANDQTTAADDLTLGAALAQQNQTTTDTNSGSTSEEKAAIALHLTNASITIGTQTTANTTIDVSTGATLSFTLTPDSGYRIASVKVTHGANQTDVAYTQLNDGTYQVPAEYVDATLSITAVAELIQTTTSGDSSATDDTQSDDSAESVWTYTKRSEQSNVIDDGTASQSLKVGETANISVGSTQMYRTSFTSNNESVAVVSQSWGSTAELRGIGAGTAQITATYNDAGWDYHTATWNVTVTNDHTVTFDANGGSVSAPDAQTDLLEGKVITLPDYTGTKSGYQFIGWSTDNNATGAGSWHYTKAVYAAGSSYTVTDEDVTLYAVWASDYPATGNFFIRLDGTIPTEPQPHSSSEYSPGIYIAGSIPHAAFHTDSTVGIGNYLSSVPTDDQIKSVYSKYDPSTQYVMWYVVKHEGGDWHVDGVLLDKAKVNLSYNANAPTGIWSNMPDGAQYSVGAKTNVSSKIPTRSDGYTFTGWNTKADGTGTSYSANDALTMDQSMTLYAQWQNENWITIAAGSVTKPYDGTPLTINNTQYTVTGKLSTGDSITDVVLSGTQTNVGSSATTVKSYRIVDAEGNDVTSSYKNVNTYNGTVNVTPLALTVTAASASKTYDGTALTDDKATVDGTLAKGDSISYDVTGSVTDVETTATPNVVSNVKVMHTNADKTQTDVTGNYSISKTDGSLKINPRTVTVSSDSANKTYDGTPLVASGVHYANDAFASGEGFASCTATGSQTLVGYSDNTISYTLSASTKASNYTITTKPGTLTVTQAAMPLTVTAGSTSKTYDGTALTDNKATVGGTLAKDDTVSYVVTGSATNVADTKTDNNVVSSIKVMHTNADNTQTDVTANYKIAAKNGTLSIDPRLITITAPSANKAYDGTALTAPITSSQDIATALTGGSFVKGQGFASITAEGSQTLVGTSDNAITGYTFAEGTAAENYKVTEAKGKLSITNENPIALTVTAASASKTYDGTALTDDSATVDGKLADGDSISYDVAGSVTDVASAATPNIVSNIKVTHTDANGKATDVTANYAITAKNGTLSIDPRAITITAASNHKAYDGTALTDTDWSITNNSFVDGQGLATVAVKGSQTLVGTSDNTIDAYTLTDKTVAANYTITEQPGTLTVDKAEIALTIEANSATKTYDGTELTDAGWSQNVDDTLIYTGLISSTGDTITSADVKGSITDAGSTANVASNAKIMHGTDDVTDNYNITYTNGALTVTQRPILLVADSASKAYDGTELTAPTAKIDSGSFVDGQGFASIRVQGSQLQAGSSNNVVAGWDFDAATNANNYAVTTQNGTLTVTKASIALTITAASSTKTYDGNELTDNAYVPTGQLAQGDTLVSAQVNGAQTDVGTGINTVSHAVIKHGTADVTDNYNITYKDGSLTVTPAEITVKAASASKVYDGTPLTQSKYTVTGSFAAGEGFASVSTKGSQLYAGSSANNVVYQLKGNTKASNYKISIADGELTVTRASLPITITATSDTKTYDGVALLNSKFSQTSGQLATGDELASVNVTGTILDAGTINNVASSAKIMHGTTDVTDNYTITYVAGTLTVNPRLITIMAPSSTKPYDGTALTAAITNQQDIATALIGGSFVSGQGLSSITTSGSQTLVGSSANTITDYAFAQGTNAANYTVTKQPGTLSITNENPIALTVTAASASKTYDGTALTDDSAAVDGKLADGDSISYDVTGSVTDVASAATPNIVSNIKVTHTDANGNATDVTANYAITPKNGTLSIDPRAIAIAPESAKKVYDGTPLTDSNWSITSGSFVDGQGLASVTVEGSQTFAGSSENEILSYTFNDQTNAANYVVTTKPNGLLTVTQAELPLTITAKSLSKTYDGTALTDNSYEISGGQLATGDTLVSADVDGSITDAGSTANVASNAKIMHGTTNVTNNYKISYTDGTLTVNPCVITITAPSATKAYDGTALTASITSSQDITAAITGGVFVNGQGLSSITTDGSQTLVGSSVNTVSDYTFKDGTNADNYQVTTKTGTLTVTRASIPLTIGAQSATKQYDGAPLTDHDWDLVDGVLAEGDSIEAVSVNGSQTNVGTSANQAMHAVIMHDGVDVTANYSISYRAGSLTVTAQPGVPPAVPAAPGTSNPSNPSTPGTPGQPPAGTTPLNAVVVPVANAMQTLVSPLTGESQAGNAQGQVNEEELTDDDGTPLGAFDAEPVCWVHWYMMFGILVTLIYGAGVLIRRTLFTRKMHKREKAILSGDPVDQQDAQETIEANPTVCPGEER